jgi:hypothetical protein
VDDDFWSGVGVDLHLEPDVSAGRRTGLERALRDAVRAGRLTLGTRLPATRRLAAELGISRGTAKAAYDRLIAEGCLTARQGSGTEVASLPADGATADVRTPRARAPRFDLRPGSPDVNTFPAAAWLRALRRAIATAPSVSRGTVGAGAGAGGGWAAGLRPRRGRPEDEGRGLGREARPRSGGGRTNARRGPGREAGGRKARRAPVEKRSGPRPRWGPRTRIEAPGRGVGGRGREAGTWAEKRAGRGEGWGPWSRNGPGRGGVLARSGPG